MSNLAPTFKAFAVNPSEVDLAAGVDGSFFETELSTKEGGMAGVGDDWEAKAGGQR